MGIQSVANETTPGEWILNGEKTWIGGAAWAGVITTFVKEHAADGASRGITGFVLEQGRRGLRQGPEQLTMGVRATVQNRLYYENLPLEAGDRLGNSGEGMRIAADTMNLARFGIGVMALGGAKRAMQIALRYATRRTVNTGVLAEHPLVAGDLTDAALGIAALEAMLTRCAQELDGAGSGVPDVDRVPEAWPLVAKVFGSELCGQVVDRAMQMLGGRGYMETNGIAQLWRDARILRIFEGPTETLEYHLGNLMSRGHLDACLRMHDGPESVAIANMLRADLDALLARCKDRHLYRSLAGSISCWAVLAMVLSDGDSSKVNMEALAWVRRRYREALARAEERTELHPRLAEMPIAEHIAGYADAIGDIEQTLPGAEFDLDQMLRGDEVSAAALRQAFMAAAGAFDSVSIPRPATNVSSRIQTQATAVGKSMTATQPQPAPRPTVGTSTPPRRIPPRRPGGGTGTQSASTIQAVRRAPAVVQASAGETTAPLKHDVTSIAEMLAKWFCASANLPREVVTPEAPLAELGLDSLSATELTVQIEEQYQVRVQPAVLWECPNLLAVATYVAGLL